MNILDDFVLTIGEPLLATKGYPKDDRRDIWVGLKAENLDDQQRKILAENWKWHAAHKAYGQATENECSVPYIKRKILMDLGRFDLAKTIQAV